MPKSYENFVVAMETRDSLPSLEILKIKLLEERDRRGSTYKTEHYSEQQAFQATTAKEKKREENSHIKCYKCGQ